MNRKMQEAIRELIAETKELEATTLELALMCRNLADQLEGITERKEPKLQ